MIIAQQDMPGPASISKTPRGESGTQLRETLRPKRVVSVMGLPSVGLSVDPDLRLNTEDTESGHSSLCDVL